MTRTLAAFRAHYTMTVAAMHGTRGQERKRLASKLAGLAANIAALEA
jgi:hypothetical protein